MKETELQKNMFSKNKKILLSLFVLLLFFGACTLILLNGGKNNADSNDLYSKEIQIGNTTLNLVVRTIIFHSEDNGNWLSGEYQFYSIGKKPVLLAKVSSLIPPEYNKKTDVDPFFFTKDITNDGVPEIFVLVEQNASNLREYEILRLDNGQLVNIKLENQKDNWVDFDDVDYKDGYISLDWHGPTSDYKVGRNYFKLEGNVLTFIRGVVFEFIDYTTKNKGETCDVGVKNAGELEFTIVENNVPCGNGVFDFDKYSGISAGEAKFKNDLNIAITEPKWKALAISFKETCDSGAVGSATFGESHTFRELVQSSQSIRKNSDGSSIFIIPCGQGSYQSSYLVALYDGNIYTPIQIPTMDKEKKIQHYNSATEMEYFSDKDIFISTARLNGMGTCMYSGEYKFIGSGLVLQKFTADWDCEDQELNEKVVYDINSSCELGVVGPAPDPLGGTISLAMKEAAIAAAIRRNEINLSNNVSCIRAWNLVLTNTPEMRKQNEKLSDKTILSDAAFFASLMPIPDPVIFRTQLLSEDAEWSYDKGELFVMIKTKEDDPQHVIVQNEDGTPIPAEPGGSWGFSIHYQNGMWY